MRAPGWWRDRPGLPGRVAHLGPGPAGTRTARAARGTPRPRPPAPGAAPAATRPSASGAGTHPASWSRGASPGTEGPGPGHGDLGGPRPTAPGAGRGGRRRREGEGWEREEGAQARTEVLGRGWDPRGRGAGSLRGGRPPEGKRPEGHGGEGLGSGVWVQQQASSSALEDSSHPSWSPSLLLPSPHSSPGNDVSFSPSSQGPAC